MTFEARRIAHLHGRWALAMERDLLGNALLRIASLVGQVDQRGGGSGGRLFHRIATAIGLLFGMLARLRFQRAPD